MKSKSIQTALTSLLLLGSGLSLHASVDSALTVDLKCNYQLRTSVKNGVESGAITALRINSKQLITLIGRESGVVFRTGSVLKVATNGKVFVASQDGKTQTDVSRYISACLEPDEAIFSGEHNTVTGQRSLRNYFPIELKINLTGIRGRVSGIANEALSAAKPNRDGVQVIVGSSKATVNGPGEIDGKPGYHEGTLSLSGREAAVR